MREHPLRAILSRILSTSQDPSEVEVAYIHRGAPGDQMRIRVSSINRLGKGWFMLEDGQTQIPFHRVLNVKNKTSGVILWEKRKPPLTSNQDP